MTTTLAPAETATLLAQLFVPTRGALTQLVHAPYPALFAVLEGADLIPTANESMVRVQMAHSSASQFQKLH
ncbi:MAG: hypothetical protein OHK0052_20610 [Anaerolineales bacterium]